MRTYVPGVVGEDRLVAARAVLEAHEESGPGRPMVGLDWSSDRSSDRPSDHSSDREAGEAWAGLLIPGVHEWLTASEGNGLWLAPVGVLIDLAWRALGREPGGGVVWVGRRCWPYAHALVRRDPAEAAGGIDRRLLGRSVLVDPPSRAERVWAVDLALRCAGVAAVIADGSGLTMAESRRLQLAAAAGGSRAMLARPATERKELSAARTRWLVTPAPSEDRRQAWTVQLLRRKGVRPAAEGAQRWAARRDHATGALQHERHREHGPAHDVGLAAGLAGRSAPAPRARIA